MKLINLAPRKIYTIQYDDEDMDEYNNIFDRLTNYLSNLKFFEVNYYEISPYMQRQVGIPPEETDAWAKRATDEAIDLDLYFENLINSAASGDKVNIWEEFEWYENERLKEYPGYKCYGTKRPSLTRIYAMNVHGAMLIVYGGIKINNPISKCPVLAEELNKVMESVHSWLKKKEILTIDDLDKASC